jgi:hypothetical protein
VPCQQTRGREYTAVELNHAIRLYQSRAVTSWLAVLAAGSSSSRRTTWSRRRVDGGWTSVPARVLCGFRWARTSCLRGFSPALIRMSLEAKSTMPESNRPLTLCRVQCHHLTSDLIVLRVGDGPRTRDLHLGKVALYRLSYFHAGALGLEPRRPEPNSGGLPLPDAPLVLRCSPRIRTWSTLGQNQVGLPIPLASNDVRAPDRNRTCVRLLTRQLLWSSVSYRGERSREPGGSGTDR